MEWASSFNFDKDLTFTSRDSGGIAGLTAKYQKETKMWRIHVVQEDPKMNLAVGGIEDCYLWHQRLGHRAMPA